jgi:hypothetical protein
MERRREHTKRMPLYRDVHSGTVRRLVVTFA